MKFRIATAALLQMLSTGIILGGEPNTRGLRLYGVIDPTVEYNFRDHRTFSAGLNYQSPKLPFSVGFDLIQTHWFSNEFYKIEKIWLSPDQSIGHLNEILSHSLIGIALNAGVDFARPGSLWFGTTMQVGIYLASALNPRSTYPFDLRERDAQNREYLVSPFIRFNRQITPNLPLVASVQVHYIPSVGIVSQFMMGVNISLLN